MNDLVQRLNQASNKNKHTPIGVLWNLCDEAADKIEEQEAEIERLQALLNPASFDTDLQQPGSQLATVNDYLALLSCYIADYMPGDAVPGDEYFGAWERAARPILQRLFDEIERLRAENQQLRERQETLELRNLPEWKPTITPEALK